ncbi:SLATT domain-containing protein [Bradyrhizobium sp. AZCC 1693]|uniref:SLATT domain-containing protein n=1 Tax=Bradyrhizobium sp. AZCC 1693 TaxID=3117029 RepID=UPI002FEFCCA1
MADVATSDRPPSKVRDEVILEAQRLEERTGDSAKGHHVAAEGWEKRGFRLGLPTALISGVTSLAVFAQASKDIWWVGFIAVGLSILVTILTTLTTFLNPNEKENAHITAAHAYDRLNNDARMFSTIECWRDNATEEALTAKLFELVERRNKLNADSPQIPPWAWAKAQERIKKGETTFAVDKKPESAPVENTPPKQLTFSHGRTKTVVVNKKLEK